MLDASSEGSDMDPQNPPERRAFESPLVGDPPPPADRSPRGERGRKTGWAMLLAVVLLAAIAVLIVLL
jgi:hypothetical protein